LLALTAALAEGMVAKQGAQSLKAALQGFLDGNRFSAVEAGSAFFCSLPV
jgi:hypothetical protein